MLKVELRSLEQEDVIVQEMDLAAILGLDLAPELSTGPLEIFCQLSKCEDLIVAKGWVKGKMLLACDRCLETFENGYKSYFELQYRSRTDKTAQIGEDEELPVESVETVYFEGEIVDIGDQIRQTVLLSVPMRALCGSECRGLCGECGCNLNKDSCQCSSSFFDPRWSKLKNWKPGNE